jgi:hypothetical protein
MANDEGDEQDLAEAFDETHREGEDPNLFDVEDELDPDLDSRAYDATRAEGDEDEEEDQDDEDLDDLDKDDLDDEDELDAGDKTGLILAEDQAEDSKSVTALRNRRVDKFESNRPLSDEQIADLGYAPPTEPKPD